MTDHPTRDGGSTEDDVVTRELDADERPSTTVVRGVASLTDTPPLDLPPLYDAIEPAVVDAVGDADAAGEQSLVFDCCDCRITVTGERIRVERFDPPTE